MSFQALKADLERCDLASEENRRALRGHLQRERGRLEPRREGLASCLDAAALLIDGAGGLGEGETREVQELLLRLVDLVASIGEPGPAHPQGEPHPAPGAADRGPSTPVRPPSPSSAGVRILNHMAFGDVIVQLGLVTQPVVDRGLLEATRCGRSLSDVLVAVGAASAEDIAHAEALHERLTSGAGGSEPDTPDTRPAAAHRILLGELLVAQGTIDRKELERALAHQRRHGLRLGESLQKLGYLSADAVMRAVDAQSRADRS